MKEKLTEEIKDILSQSTNWLKLEVEYTKFTLAEKFTLLMAALVIGAVCLLMGMAALLLFAFALVETFAMIMSPALAYLAVGGIIILLIIILYLCRRPLLLNPISKFITKLMFSHK